MSEGTKERIEEGRELRAKFTAKAEQLIADGRLAKTETGFTSPDGKSFVRFRREAIPNDVLIVCKYSNEDDSQVIDIKTAFELEGFTVTVEKVKL